MMDMNGLLSQMWTGIDWVVFAIGLQLVLRKLQEKNGWLAWIPGVRFFKLGQALGMGGEGILCGVLEVLLYVEREAGIRNR